MHDVKAADGADVAVRPAGEPLDQIRGFERERRVRIVGLQQGGRGDEGGSALGVGEGVCGGGWGNGD